MPRQPQTSRFLEADFWREFAAAARTYFKPKFPRRRPIETPAALREEVDRQASYVAQTALYGYMKTRAGTSFPELFETPALVESINIAKWQIYLACVSDLAVYVGVLLHRDSSTSPSQIRALLTQLVGDIITAAGNPPDAGADFPDAVKKLRARIADADFAALGDDDSAFTQSPAALVYWSPVADELKKRDTLIVRNSVRFRWQEIRRNFRRRLRAGAVLAHGLK